MPTSTFSISIDGNSNFFINHFYALHFLIAPL
ncbi:hypothetical protein [Enterocloster phage PMBT24]|uniref:Uncharacterized protein n=1 Tax=Enterocloster phage PMBT24 TaxID=3025413 RepID=A0AAT9TRM0_9CAUD|nr:hypothetical protein [Enterocloster phage PMBT24]